MESLQTKISVALASYNGAPFIQDQVDSILKQSHQPLELIIQDDVSSDDTVSIAQEYQRQYPQLVKLYCNETNLGFVKNFERAMSNCSGEIIVLSDQDDIWLPNRLQQIARTFVESPDCGLVVTNAYLLHQSANQGTSLLYPQFTQTTTTQNQLLSSLFRNQSIKGCTIAFRRKYLPYLLPVSSTRWGHDHWIVCILSLISQVSILPEPLMFYRRHAANFGNDLYAKSLSSRVRAVINSLTQEAYEFDYLRWKELLDHVRTNTSFQIDHDERWTEGILQIKNRLDYAQKRVAMQKDSRLKRVLQALALATNGQYRRYGRGNLTLIKDVVA